MDIVLQWVKTQWTGITVMGLIAVLGWLLTHQLERRKARREERQEQRAQRDAERADHEHRVVVWKDIAEARRTQMEATVQENAKLENRVKRNRRRISSLNRAWAEAEEEARALADGYAAARNEADAWRSLAEQTRAALHRAGLCMFASYEMFTRARRLQKYQSVEIGAIFDEAINAVCEVYGVDPAKVRATFDSEAPPDRSLLAPATLALMLENIRSRVDTHLVAPVQNAVLGAKVIGLVQENSKVPFEELAPKYFDMLRGDTEELFQAYPGALDEQLAEEQAEGQAAEKRAAEALAARAGFGDD